VTSLRQERTWQEEIMIGREETWFPTAKSIVDFAEIESSHSILDVGSGFGDVTEEAVGRGCKVVSLDFSIRYLEFVAKKKQRDQLVLGDATRMPFRWGLFDRVVSKDIWHNIPSSEARNRFIVEIGRVAKPKGLVLSAVWNKLYCYLNPVRMVRRPPVDDPYHHYFMPSEVKRVFRLAGLDIFEVQASKTPFRNRLPFLDRILSPWYFAFYLDVKARKKAD